MKPIFFYKWLDILKNYGRPEMIDEAVKIFTESRLFILTSAFHTKLAGSSVPSVYEEPLNLPFKICTFEYLTNTCIQTVGVGENSANAEQLDVVQMTVMELAPLKYLFIILYQFRGKPELRVVTEIEGGNNTLFCTLKRRTKEILDILNSKTIVVGAVRPKQKVKVRVNKVKKFLKFHPIIICTSKQSQHEITSELGSLVDWSHRWEVRGHWRRVKGVGYDREGFPIPEFTWIRPYLKGNEAMPVIRKARVVNG